MDTLRLFLLDQGFPVEYELDKFNTPHTGTTLRHPQNWLCRLRCRISLRCLATTSPLGNIFWRHSRFSPKQPETQTHGDFNVSFLNGKHDIRYIRRTYLPRTSNCNVMAKGFQFMPLSLVRLRTFRLVRCNIEGGVKAGARGRMEVSLRCHNSPRRNG